jgi:hypothetical protein
MSNSSDLETEGLDFLRKDAELAAAEIKSAAVTPDDARRSLDRLDTLERNKPTVRQVGRYGVLGGLSGAAIGATANAIEHGGALKGATPKAKLLNVGANAVKGALGGGAVPLLRAHSDRQAEMGTLRRFMNQDKVAGRWLHSRAEHLLAKNPSMPKGEAFAIATQQAEATGHTPNSFGTAEGKATAKAKFNTPKDDEQRANPGGLDSPKLAALGAAPLWRAQAGFTPPGMQTAAQRLKKSMSMGTVDPSKGLKPLNIKVGSTIVQIVKRAGIMDLARQAPTAMKTLPGAAKSLVTGATPRMGHLNEVAGLGILAVPGLDTLQSRIRARAAGDKSEHGAEKRQLLGEGAHAALDVGGLGMLAAPALAHLKHAFANSGYAGNVAQNGPGMKSHSQLPAFTRPALQVKESAPLKRLGELVTGSRASTLRDAASRHAQSKTEPARKAARKLKQLAVKEDHNVGRTQGALAGAAALGAASDAKGIHDRVKESGVGVGAGMSTSQYSGPLSYGSFKMTSGIPAFRRPAMTKNDDSLEGAGWMTGQNKESTAQALVSLFGKEAAMGATGAMSPAASLKATQRVGGPKVTGFAGPSIADISKPQGFGKPLPGAQKNQL